MSKNDMLDTVFTATCKLSLIRTVIESLINIVEDAGEIKTAEKAMEFAYNQDTIDDFLHIAHDGIHYAIQTLNELQKGGAE